MILLKGAQKARGEDCNSDRSRTLSPYLGLLRSRQTLSGRSPYIQVTCNTEIFTNLVIDRCHRVVTLGTAGSRGSGATP